MQCLWVIVREVMLGTYEILMEEFTSVGKQSEVMQRLI